MSIFESADYAMNVVERDGFDDDAYARSLDACPELGKLEDELSAKHQHGGAFLEDLHASLLNPDPEIKAQVPAPVAGRAELLAEIYQTTDYQRWHSQTQYDHVRSALGAVELGKAFRGKLPEDKDERRRVFRGWIKRAEDQVERSIDSYEALAGGSIAEHNLTDLGEVVKAGAILKRSTKVQRIIEQAGRLRLIAKNKYRARVRHGPDEIVDVELGNDLSHVLPSELVFCNHPVLGFEFARKFLSRQLLQYRVEGREPRGRGPIVVIIDTSSSMRADGREFWAKGIALALMSLAIEERRDFTVILFSGCGDMKRFDFEKPSLDKIVAAIEFSFDGDTDFETPLTEGLKAIEASKFKKADMILLTDGDGQLSPGFASDFVKRKTAKAARLFTVLIGFNSAKLNVVSDGIERIDDLAQDDAVADLVFGSL